jgi:hypothetical protein
MYSTEQVIKTYLLQSQHDGQLSPDPEMKAVFRIYQINQMRGLHLISCDWRRLDLSCDKESNGYEMLGVWAVAAPRALLPTSDSFLTMRLFDLPLAGCVERYLGRVSVASHYI